MIKRFLTLLLVLLPLNAHATYITGVDDIQGDRTPNIGLETQQALDKAVLTYYQDPSNDKIDTILDIMANSSVLERKTSWAPLVGFFTVVFPAHKDKVMTWMSRYDYNTYAQYVIVNSLMHAKMRESALLFAKAHQWEAEDLYRLREQNDIVDLKKLTIAVPGHIDTLWGAYFASGDVIYVDQIIEHMLNGKIPEYAKTAFMIPDEGDPLEENKLLAATTLREYARDHKPVRDDLEKRYKDAPEGSGKKKLFKELLGY